MKKTMILILVFCAVSGCSKKEPEGPPVVGMQPEQSEGYWVDDDTWRITATGRAGDTQISHSPVQRREMACTAAKLNAMARAMIELGESESRSVKIDKNETDENSLAFSGLIRNGSVVEKNFNSDTETCEVVYEIKETGLRGKVDTRLKGQ